MNPVTERVTVTLVLLPGQKQWLESRIGFSDVSLDDAIETIIDQQQLADMVQARQVGRSFPDMQLSETAANPLTGTPAGPPTPLISTE